MNRAPLRLGVLGGTLDPVHVGHLAAAWTAIHALSLDAVWLMPAHVPPLKPPPGASPWHRFAMAALAVAGEDRVAVSDLELSRTGPSFTIDTLQALQHQGHRSSQIFFITGADAFAGIETWHRFPALLDQAHVVVVTRPGHEMPAAVITHPAIAPRLERGAGTRADHAPQRTDSCRIWCVEADTPDVSSSEIRQRVLTGQEVGDRVPPLVAAHIRQHGLYTSTAAARPLHGED